MITRRSIVSAAALSGLLASPAFRANAQAYPTGPLNLVVPFPPGGGIDAVLRAMAPKLQERMGKPVVVENRAGGSGVIATNHVVKSSPDGHTILASASLLAANPRLFKSLPFDTLKDLQAINLLFHTPLALVANPELPARSVAELVALLKQKPGEISYAHSGPGSSLHLAAELFQAMTGTKMNGVVYRGAPQGLTDVMAGHVALMFADTGTVVAQVADGKVRALGVTSTVRVPAMPAVPTIAETVPGFDAVGWTLLCVPSATPGPVVQRLHAEIKAVTAMPDIQDMIVRLGAVPSDGKPPAELQKFLASEIDRWGDIIERAGAAKSL